MASLAPQSAKMFQNTHGGITSSNCTTTATMTTLMTGKKNYPGKPYMTTTSNRRSLNVSRTSATSGNPKNLLLANADLFYSKRSMNNE